MLEVTERQKILRLLVKEVLVGKDSITIRHSIRITHTGLDPSGPSGTLSLPHTPQQRPTPQPGPHYLLRSGRHYAVAREAPRVLFLDVRHLNIYCCKAGVEQSARVLCSNFRF